MKRQKRKDSEYVSLSSEELDKLPPSEAYDILFKDYADAIDRKLDDSCIQQILQLAHIVKKRVEFIADTYEKQYNELVGIRPSTIDDVRAEMEDMYKNKRK